MPNKKAAIKHLRQTKKRTLANSLVKRRIKEMVKKSQKAMADSTIKEKRAGLEHDFQKIVDKAIKTGILKPNAGNRHKSRFMKRLRTASAK
ncbi:MAG: 30S ribosomal protein S20 [Patescibacteria group bacterium]